ncbi:MAG: rod shape-determining protein MreC [Verrucomicrobiae bacterium]|nr:rod shape-determining protein MreC [Verrucomicrobiae bacterium]
MKGRKNLFWALGILLVVLILIALPAGCSSSFKMNVTQLFSPLLDASTSLRQKLDIFRKATSSQTTLVRQTEDLHEEVVKLQSQLQQMKELEKENDRLRQMLDFKGRTTLRLKPARVINRAASNWWVAMDIDAGKEEGVQPNMAVISAAGLVGKTTEVGRHVARVLLVADPNCKVAAMVDSTRDSGIVEGDTQGNIEDARCLIQFINRNSKVKVDDTVITSGLDELYPKGIIVGRVMQVNEEQYGLYKSARIELAADLMRLEDVFVVVGQ